MRKIKIIINQTSKTSGEQARMVINGTIEENSFETEHDVARVLCAMEFAINNHAELPLRVHINQDEN